ncbi:type II secretion system protein GspD [Comamonas terrigena]|uniref:type II secretion system protein GspD n=1 Tax=Comamonas terrigena TaxID=32013 RepID=UPI00289DD291|nr:hypothetical protein [Comamonas terrigena]
MNPALPSARWRTYWAASSIWGGGSAAGNPGHFIQLKNTALDAVYSMLEADSRFKMILSPSLRIQSGARGVFSVGQDVPVLGALSFPQGAGQGVQSVEYRSSGVIFDIKPTVRNAVIELALSQQLSDFIKTTTGVNNSPTLTKRELKTIVGLQDGDVIVLGGAWPRTKTLKRAMGHLSSLAFCTPQARRSAAQKYSWCCRCSGCDQRSFGAFFKVSFLKRCQSLRPSQGLARLLR